MKEQTIVRKIKRDYHALKKAGKQVADRPTAENIHQFRLRYKHLNAFLDMLTHRKWAKDLIMPSGLEKVYKSSGTIRKLQLQMAAFELVADTSAGAYRNALRSTLAVAEQRFLHQLSIKLIDRCRKQHVAGIKGGFRVKDYYKFLAAKTKFINKAIHKESISASKLHAIRKTLKVVLYTKEFFAGVFQPDTETCRIYNSSFKVLLQRLGLFQDQCNVIDLLEPERYPKLSHEVKLWIKGEQQRLRSGKSKSKKRLLAQLKRDF